MRKLMKIKARNVKPNPHKVRQPLAEDKSFDLGRSVIKRQEIPLIVQADYTIIDGDSRWEGVMRINPDFELECIVTDEELTPTQVTEMMLVNVMQRSDFTHYEKYLGCKSWCKQNPQGIAAELAERLDVDCGTISRIVSLSKCIPAWHEAAQAGRVGFTDWSVASQLDARGQHELLEMKLRGATAKELQSQSRRKRNGQQASPVRNSKIRIELPSGVIVTFSGKELSLDDAIEAAAQARKVLKEGQEQGLTARTIQKVSADRAKPQGDSSPRSTEPEQKSEGVKTDRKVG